MTEHTFTVMREMSGDRDYREGDGRKLLALDALHLVRSGALKPKGEAAEKAMAELMNDTPDERSGIVQAVKTDAPRNKDAGNAPANKGASGGNARTRTPAAPKPQAARVAIVTTGGPAAGTGTGNDGAGGHADAGAGAAGEGDAGAGADGAGEGGTAQEGAAGGAPAGGAPAAGTTGKRR